MKYYFTSGKNFYVQKVYSKKGRNYVDLYDIPEPNESTKIDEAVRPNDKVFVKGKNKDGKTVSYFAFGGSFKEVKAFRRAIKKLLSDHAQKKFDVYVDGNSDLVDSDSSKTIVRFDDKMTVADVAKAVEEFINKEYPPKKAAPAVDYKTDTRTIVTTDDEKAKELKNKYHGKGTKVRIMKRKSGNKVYIDSKTPEIHKAINDALADELSESKGFEPHWMYDPETGEKERAEKPEDHERLKALGWGHEPPVNEALAGELN